jgi:hypothetical protein
MKVDRIGRTRCQSDPREGDHDGDTDQGRSDSQIRRRVCPETKDMSNEFSVRILDRNRNMSHNSPR